MVRRSCGLADCRRSVAMGFSFVRLHDLNCSGQCRYAEWTLGDGTSEGIRITYPHGRARPVLSIDLPARPKDPQAEVEKRVFVFHFTIRRLLTFYQEDSSFAKIAHRMHTMTYK